MHKTPRNKRTRDSCSLKLIFLKGVVTTPLMVCRQLHQNAKQSDPGHLSNLFYILCGHFDEKNPGVPPNTGVG